MASEPVEHVLDVLKGVMKSGTGWSARCPAHDDRMNSLSIGEGEDGQALIYCHAGCSFQEIVAAMGISVRSLFPRRKGAA